MIQFKNFLSINNRHSFINLKSNWQYLLLIFVLVTFFNFNSIFATSQKAYINSNFVNCRTESSLGAPVVTVLNKGTEITILESADSWYKISLGDDTVGWVFSKYVSINSLDLNNNHLSITDEIVTYAKTFLGIKYLYGGSSSSGFDCSGFTMHVFSKFNISLPHSSFSQLSYGEKVSFTDLIPGDLVFFKTLNSTRVNHVGIYFGNGQFIHASSGSGYVKIDTLLTGYYHQRFQEARRIINTNKNNTPI